MMRLFWLVVLSAILVGCEAQATPIANIATPTATLAPTPVPVNVIRYGIAANIVPYLGDVPVSYETVDGTTALTDYDLVVTYGALDGWERAPQAHRVSLIINPNLAPLDETVIRDLIPSVIDVQTIISNLNINGTQQTTIQTSELSATEIRTTLANSGYPDGVQLTLATEQVPAIDTLLSQFSALGLDLRLIPLRENSFSQNQAHLGLFLWTDDSERSDWVAQVGENSIIDLWTMPISYITSDGVTVDFTADGIPYPVE